MGYAKTGDPAEPAERAALHLETGVLAGGSSIEAIGGLVAAVLAIVGVAAHEGLRVAGAATIAIGVALLAHGISVAARWRMIRDRLVATRDDKVELVGGIGTEMFGGLVGIVLAILALAHVMSFVMLPIAAIVYGSALLLGGAAQPELEALVPERDPRLRRITQGAIEASGGVMVMVGIAAAVLGILALVAAGPLLTLTLVAMLAIGVALAVAGGALTARFARHV